MAYFPLFISLTDKHCLVIGGGGVALRKIKTLLSFQADVYVVAETVCNEIRKELPPERIRIGQVKEEEISGSYLVVCATDNREVNARAARLCREYRIPVNVADSPKDSTFLFPSVVRKGEASIGINSGTNSPALSKHIREIVEKAVPDSYGEMTLFLGKIRERIKKEFEGEERSRILKEAAAETFSKERVLTEEEIKEIIRRNKNDRASGRPVRY
ncbi:MAG: bifunctional precorrin-2 dehydrogenase/sirohydrochlorin ferrochelatase [Lachnospiraceae bacterium]|nr:bifunctional precorrin-2 dehydrogenase/sirohydrochlorin ferrochelatase [Lachnospiraceae bacterium]